VLDFFFGAARFLAATLFATFFFARELDLLASIAVATLSKTAPTTVVLAALAVAAAAAAASATSPANTLASSAALFPAATTVSCTLVIIGFFASIAVATLSKTTLAAVVLAALAVAAALATSPCSGMSVNASPLERGLPGSHRVDDHADGHCNCAWGETVGERREVYSQVEGASVVNRFCATPG
jgi:hypothetical protein